MWYYYRFNYIKNLYRVIKMIKLLASDLDGTIFDNEHQIATNNQKAIELIKKSNINFVICTGKTYSICKDVCDITKLI